MTKKIYGIELILDLFDCDMSKCTRLGLTIFFKQLCELLDMEREDLHFWDDQDTAVEERRTEPHIEGVSAVQFIVTSNITVHALRQLRTVYINIFSCKDYNVYKAAMFCRKFFQSKSHRVRIVEREYPSYEID